MTKSSVILGPEYDRWRVTTRAKGVVELFLDRFSRLASLDVVSLCSTKKGLSSS